MTQRDALIVIFISYFSCSNNIYYTHLTSSLHRFVCVFFCVLNFMFSPVLSFCRSMRVARGVRLSFMCECTNSNEQLIRVMWVHNVCERPHHTRHARNMWHVRRCAERKRADIVWDQTRRRTSSSRTSDTSKRWSEHRLLIYRYSIVLSYAVYCIESWPRCYCVDGRLFVCSRVRRWSSRSIDLKHSTGSTVSDAGCQNESIHSECRSSIRFLGLRDNEKVAQLELLFNSFNVHRWWVFAGNDIVYGIV